MKKLSAKNLLTLLTVLTFVLAFGACKSSTTDVPPPQPPEPAPMPAPVPPTEAPTDFVENEPQTEELPSDADELNRLAQERGWIQDAFFQYDSSTLTAEARSALQASATWLKGYPQYGLLIEGHCDERGTEQYNLALGERRAASAREYLVSLGIGDSRIRTLSLGEERPFDSGATESAFAKNRRAHLVLTR